MIFLTKNFINHEMYWLLHTYRVWNITGWLTKTDHHWLTWLMLPWIIFVNFNFLLLTIRWSILLCSLAFFIYPQNKGSIKHTKDIIFLIVWFLAIVLSIFGNLTPQNTRDTSLSRKYSYFDFHIKPVKSSSLISMLYECWHAQGRLNGFKVRRQTSVCHGVCQSTCQVWTTWEYWKSIWY